MTSRSNTRSVIRYWHYLQSEDRLRGAILYQIESRKASLDDLAEKLSAKKYNLTNYLKNERPALNDYEIIKLANMLGLEISLDIKFTSHETSS